MRAFLSFLYGVLILGSIALGMAWVTVLPSIGVLYLTGWL